MNLLPMTAVGRGRADRGNLGRSSASRGGRHRRRAAGGPRAAVRRRAPAGSIALDLTVGAIERVGPETFVYGATGPRRQTSSSGVPGQAAPAPGERVGAIAARDKLHVFSADGRSRLSA